MTLGEKLREARKKNGLTQEQLAEKLAVSRQAVTKWESDKGIPDITNLKAVSGLLDVSIDYLLDTENKADVNLIREAIDSSIYGKKLKKWEKDQLVHEKYPDAEIRMLIAEKLMDKPEKIAETFIWLATPVVNVIPFMNSLKMVGTEYYLVNTKERQFLVSVSNEFIESRQLAERQICKRGNKFVIGRLKFMDCGLLKLKSMKASRSFHN